jgi:hypothetical protein
VEPNPEVLATAGKMSIQYDVSSRTVPVGQSAKVRFKLSDPTMGEALGEIPDVNVLYYRADGRGRTVVPAVYLGEGRYEAEVKIGSVATYYVFVGSRSKQLRHSELPFLSLMGVPATAAKEAK